MGAGELRTKRAVQVSREILGCCLLTARKHGPVAGQRASALMSKAEENSTEASLPNVYLAEFGLYQVPCCSAICCCLALQEVYPSQLQSCVSLIRPKEY